MVKTCTAFALLALAGGCTISLSSFDYLRCGLDSDCPNGMACVNALCVAPGGTSTSGASSASGASSTAGTAGGSSSTAAATSGSGGSGASGASSGSTSGDGLAPGISITALAGGQGSPGQADGTLSSARFTYPYGIAYASEQLYVTEDDGFLRRIDLDAGWVSTVVDGGYEPTLGMGLGEAFSIVLSGTTAYVGAGGWIEQVDLTSGQFSVLGSNQNLVPYGIVLTDAGTLYLSDHTNFCLDSFDLTSKQLSSYAGTCGNAGDAPGSLSTAMLEGPTGLAFGPKGELYVADHKQEGGGEIWVIADGQVSLFAGAPCPTDTSCASPKDGPAAQATFDIPFGLAVDSKGDVFVSDEESIREIVPLPDGGALVTSLAYQSLDNTQNPLTLPGGIALDDTGKVLYIVDQSNDEIWAMTGF